ncbi:PRC-barrel domain-containing protein [Curtobacterium ammoniigenes]|uniref:PRC-barrel domain-containing protein n=1 Tax=Curtobacterium ammoniigenes TaxID=395387 RepID=UPI000836D5A3|nr:PRC-barrel domain-containing protein [Curtobacterium ammoniigenes]
MSDQHLAFSELRGCVVEDSDGRRLGRLFDVVFEPDGDDMVATGLVLARSRLGLLGRRLRVREIGEIVDASRIRRIEPGRIALEARHD